MELKYATGDPNRIQASVLIAPLWNWNEATPVIFLFLKKF